MIEITAPELKRLIEDRIREYPRWSNVTLLHFVIESRPQKIPNWGYTLRDTREGSDLDFIVAKIYREIRFRYRLKA